MFPSHETIDPIQFHIGISFLLFSVGLFGFVFRRSGIIALMCIELMLNGTNLALVSFSHQHKNPEGSSLILFVVLVAAAEAAIALSLFVSLYRKTGSVFLDDFKTLKG